MIKKSLALSSKMLPTVVVLTFVSLHALDYLTHCMMLWAGCNIKGIVWLPLDSLREWLHLAGKIVITVLCTASIAVAIANKALLERVGFTLMMSPMLFISQFIWYVIMPIARLMRLEMANLKIYQYPAVSTVAAIDMMNRIQVNLGFDPDFVALPDEVQSVLKDRFKFKLNDSDAVDVQSVFEKSLKEKTPLRDFFNRTKTAFINKHPAVIDFLFYAEKQGILPNIASKNDYKAAMRNFIVYMFVLDRLTEHMGLSANFTDKMQSHILAQRADHDIPPGFLAGLMGIWKNTGDFFEAIKTVSVDKAIITFATLRETREIKKIKSNKLRINITEAMLRDWREGFIANAFAGYVLSINPRLSVENDGTETNEVHYHFNPSAAEWSSLYHTWNLAFVLGNMCKLELILPKLLVPTVVGADPSTYVLYRTIALYLAANVHVFSKIEKKQLMEITINSKIARLWGTINYKYAVAALSKCPNFESRFFHKISGL